MPARNNRESSSGGKGGGKGNRWGLLLSGKDLSKGVFITKWPQGVIRSMHLEEWGGILLGEGSKVEYWGIKEDKERDYLKGCSESGGGLWSR